MQESELKTSLKQRLIIGAIAFLLLGSTVAVYVAITLGNDTINYSRMTFTQLQEAYNSAIGEYNSAVSDLSNQHYHELSAYRSRVKAYNAEAAEAAGVTYETLKTGDGETISGAADQAKYSAFYIGWCPDGTVFDSSFASTDFLSADAEADDAATTLALKAPLAISYGSLIEGWYIGTADMQIGGAREISIPSVLAYGSETIPCGVANSPIKFVVYAVPYQTKIHALEERLNEIYQAIAALQASNYSNYSQLDYSDSDSSANTSE